MQKLEPLFALLAQKPRQRNLNFNTLIYMTKISQIDIQKKFKRNLHNDYSHSSLMTIPMSVEALILAISIAHSTI